MSKSFMDLIIMKINKDIDDYSAVQYSKSTDRSTNSQIYEEFNHIKKELPPFIKHIGDSSILVYDDNFSHKLVAFKDIDFSKDGHPLKSKYVNIIIHYSDNDKIDTFLEVLSSLKSGVLKIIKSLKGTRSSKHEGCGISGSKCLTPRLAIKCFQLLNEELLNYMYKPDGGITTISLDKSKGIMTQRYEKISESHSSSTHIVNPPPTIAEERQSSITLKKKKAW